MRWTIPLAALLAAAPLSAQSVAIDSAVYRERAGDGAMRIEPATRLLSGDRVVTILSWDAPPHRGSYTVTSPVPAGLVLQSASQPGLEVSTDGGRSWRRLADPDRVPDGTTHLRWQVGGQGRLSYRAVVR
jgi:hypothetical protein